MAAAQSPYFTQDGPDREDSGNQYIANMRDGAVAGFKYFAFKDAAEIKVHCTGSANGHLQVSTAPDFSTLCADIFIKTAVRWGKRHPLRFLTEPIRCISVLWVVGK